MTNQFADVPDFEGRYSVDKSGNIYSNYDNFGRIRNEPKLLKPVKIGHVRNFYHAVNLYINKKVKQYSIHRIVARAFLPNPDGLPFVNHKDENTFNNDVSNLEWCTPQYNQEYSLSKKEYTFLNPEGGIVKIRNLRKFSRENGLNHAHMYQVSLGNLPSYKKWIKYP